MVVMLSFCSTKMAAISLGGRDFRVYFQRNSTDQATNRRKANLLHEHLYPSILCVQVEQKVDAVRTRILYWREKGKCDGLTGLTFRRILTIRTALFSKYHLYPQSQLTLFISYNWQCFKLNTDKNNPLLFLIFSCALLRATRHFLTFLYFWIKNCLNILLGSKLILAHCFPYFNCKIWRRFDSHRFFYVFRSVFVST